MLTIIKFHYFSIENPTYRFQRGRIHPEHGRSGAQSGRLLAKRFGALVVLRRIEERLQIGHIDHVEDTGLGRDSDAIPDGGFARAPHNASQNVDQWLGVA